MNKFTKLLLEKTTNNNKTFKVNLSLLISSENEGSVGYIVDEILGNSDENLINYTIDSIDEDNND